MIQEINRKQPPPESNYIALRVVDERCTIGCVVMGGAWVGEFWTHWIELHPEPCEGDTVT